MASKIEAAADAAARREADTLRFLMSGGLQGLLGARGYVLTGLTLYDRGEWMLVIKATGEDGGPLVAFVTGYYMMDTFLIAERKLRGDGLVWRVDRKLG